MEIKTVKTTDFEMEYFSFGNGTRTMVILPGMSLKSVMESGDAVAEQYKIFVDDYTVYVFERRKVLPEGYTLEMMAEDAAKGIKELNLSDVYLFGASLGGILSLMIAIDHPELIKKIVLGNTAAKSTEKSDKVIRTWKQYAANNEGKNLFTEMCKKIYTQKTFEEFEEVIKNISKTVTEEECKKFCITSDCGIGFDISKKLEKINIPVLCLASRDDEIFGEKDANIIVNGLKNSDVTSYIYEGYGHAAYDFAPDYKNRIYEFYK